MSTRTYPIIPKRWQKRILIATLFVLVWLVGMRIGYKVALEAFEAQPAKVVYVEVTPEPTELDTTLVTEAEAVAKVLYGMRNNSKEDLRGVINVLVNRAESPMFQASLVEVCEAPDQWVGYYDTNVITEDLYNLAYETLRSYQSNGHRMLGSDFFWFDWTSTQITFRNTYEKTATTKYYTTGG